MIKYEWIPADLRSQAKVNRGAHQLKGRICHWPYCVRCGLVALKNEATRQALRRECVTVE